MKAYRYIFPKRLKQYRERKGISRKTLAELVGLSKNTIARYEHGERFPSGETLVMLADYFDIKVEDLVGK